MQPTNLEELWDSVIFIWIQSLKECFQNTVESIPRRNETVLNVKNRPIRYQKSITHKVTGANLKYDYACNHY